MMASFNNRAGRNIRGAAYAIRVAIALAPALGCATHPMSVTPPTYRPSEEVRRESRCLHDDLCGQWDGEDITFRYERLPLNLVAGGDGPGPIVLSHADPCGGMGSSSDVYELSRCGDSRLAAGISTLAGIQWGSSALLSVPDGADAMRLREDYLGHELRVMREDGRSRSNHILHGLSLDIVVALRKGHRRSLVNMYVLSARLVDWKDEVVYSWPGSEPTMFATWYYSPGRERLAKRHRTRQAFVGGLLLLGMMTKILGLAPAEGRGH